MYENFTPKQLYDTYIKHNTSDIITDIVTFYANMVLPLDEQIDTSNEQIRIFIYYWYRVLFETAHVQIKYVPNLEANELVDFFKLKEFFNLMKHTDFSNLSLVLSVIDDKKIKTIIEDNFHLMSFNGFVTTKWHSLCIKMFKWVNRQDVICVDKIIHAEHTLGTIFDTTLLNCYILNDLLFQEVIAAKNELSTSSQWKTFMLEHNIKVFY